MPSKTINTDMTQDNTGRSIKVLILIAVIILQQKYVIDTYDELNGAPSRKRGTLKRITHLICVRTYYIKYGVQSAIIKNIRLNTMLLSFEAES